MSLCVFCDWNCYLNKEIFCCLAVSVHNAFQGFSARFSRKENSFLTDRHADQRNIRKPARGILKRVQFGMFILYASSAMQYRYLRFPYGHLQCTDIFPAGSQITTAIYKTFSLVTTTPMTVAPIEIRPGIQTSSWIYYVFLAGKIILKSPRDVSHKLKVCKIIYYFVYFVSWQILWLNWLLYMIL